MAEGWRSYVLNGSKHPTCWSPPTEDERKLHFSDVNFNIRLARHSAKSTTLKPRQMGCQNPNGYWYLKLLLLGSGITFVPFCKMFVNWISIVKLKRHQVISYDISCDEYWWMIPPELHTPAGQRSAYLSLSRQVQSFHGLSGAGPCESVTMKGLQGEWLMQVLAFTYAFEFLRGWGSVNSHLHQNNTDFEQRHFDVAIQNKPLCKEIEVFLPR